MSHDLSQRPAGEPSAPRGVNIRGWNWLLLLPFVGVLWPPLYNKNEPALAGLPFFYWYQMLWIAISVVVTIVVYRATRGEK